MSAFTAKQRDDWVAALSHARLSISPVSESPVSEEEDEDDSSTSVLGDLFLTHIARQDELISDRPDILDRDGFVYGTIVKADTTKNLNHITYNQDRPGFGPGTPSALAGVVDSSTSVQQDEDWMTKYYQNRNTYNQDKPFGSGVSSALADVDGVISAMTKQYLNHISYNQDCADVVDLKNMPTQEKTNESKTKTSTRNVSTPSVQQDDVDLETTSIDESTMATLPFDYKL